MIPSRLIEAKRDGQEIPADHLRAFLRGFLRDQLPDYQMAAFLMAVVFRGLTPAERSCVVDEMLHSGRTLAWPDLDRPVVDKHSTGGVGDKVSLILAPLAAELGLAVPMMSGRGLGHSGGTLDKLESIPGFRTQVDLQEFGRVLRALGCAMIGQTEEIAPLDRRLYSLRNVTGTVPAIPLIASSIMSKKISEGLDGLVLDVKRGSGAFLPETERALDLARTMIEIGETYDVRTSALVTAMDRPLGIACGNAIEVAESVRTLRGEGPDDLVRVTVELVTEMLVSGHGGDRDAWREEARSCLASGKAAARFARLIEAQGGDPKVVDDPDRLPGAPFREVLESEADGYVRTVEPRAIGWGVVELGGGRRTLDDDIDPAVGFEIFVAPGQPVERGRPLARIHARDQAGVEAAKRVLARALVLSDEPGESLPLIGYRVTTDGVEEVCVGPQSSGGQ